MQGGIPPALDRRRLPTWLVRLWRRLANLTPGRYFAIMEVEKRGVVRSLSILGSAKVELLDKGTNTTEQEIDPPA